MHINRLYTEPEVIDPIDFHPGVNLILGERDETSSKNNGVGKSLCIEFLNFGLLKRKADSRVAKVPKESLDPSTFICVDFTMHGARYVIRRSLEDAERPRITADGIETVYAKIADATDFLSTRMFPNLDSQIGFREILSPLIRDEKSEFKSLVACFDTKSRVPDNYAPHLMLLGIDLRTYRSIRVIQKELKDISIEEGRIKDSVQLVRQKDIKAARSDLNALEDEVEKIGIGIDTLETAPAYDIVKDEVLEIEDQVNELRLRKEVLTQRSSRLAPIALEPSLDSDDIRDFYDQIRTGLGTNIVRELEEVISFKTKIEGFQRHLLDEKREVVDVDIRDINKQLSELDRRYAKLVTMLDQDGGLKNLRQTYAAFQAKSDELGQLKSFYGRYDQLQIDRQAKKLEMEGEKLQLTASITAALERVRSFEKTILGIHQLIQGNRKASFDVMTTSKAQVIDMDMRIDDDGSYSVEREKVFIYDLALLLNNYTKHRHPGLLVHDNILNVDDDTLHRSLEFALTSAIFEDEQQYILTLNVDRIENCVDEVWYDELMSSVAASFTKRNRFLRTQYQETR